MRRFILALVGTVAGLVGLLTFKTHATTTASHVAVSTAAPANGSILNGSSGSGGSSSAATGSSSASGSASAGGSASSSAASGGSTTVTGDEVNTRWGPVQVKVTVANGKLTAVDAVEYPENNGRDQEINSYAIPELNQEAMAAGSAKIDSVSGATYTSDGYIGSLQSALNKAGLS